MSYIICLSIILYDSYIICLSIILYDSYKFHMSHMIFIHMIHILRRLYNRIYILANKSFIYIVWPISYHMGHMIWARDGQGGIPG